MTMHLPQHIALTLPGRPGGLPRLIEQDNSKQPKKSVLYPTSAMLSRIMTLWGC